jgi:glycosyltransferase involved in cell wall biosynthesis
MEKKLLIINKEPFGRITDTYKWCEYLKDEYSITFLCLSPQNGEKNKLENINIKYIKSYKNKTLRGVLYILTCLWHLLWFKGKIIIVYFDYCEIFKKFFPWKKMNLDIRTLSVTKDQHYNDKYNMKLCKVCDLYDSVTIISEDISEKMNIHNKNAYILPLGADTISNFPKKYDSIKLLYVGTLYNRNIEQTIHGLNYFIKKYPDASIEYNIIGSSSGDELEKILELTKKFNIEQYVSCHGYIPYNKLKPFFNTSNIGVSYVPITDYYDNQPVTKTYEYILSGLYTIATRTKGNQKVITNQNGLLIDDNAEDFFKALEYIYINKNKIKEHEIRQSLANCTWKSIVNEILKPILQKI